MVQRTDEAFNLRSFYDDRPVFGPEFQAAFEAHYRKSGQSRYFDIWTFHH